MSLFDRTSPRGSRRRATSPAREAAAREQRARDHLARKRRIERARLERERARAEAAPQRAVLRIVLGPIAFFSAIALGTLLAAPISEHLLMRPARLDRIAVQGASALSPEAIAREAGVERGLALSQIDPQRVREAVAAEPWVESARALRLPTGTLVISVVERKAIARFQADPDEGVELVDPQGGRFRGALENGGPLPLVQGPQTGGEPLPQDALEILAEITRYASLAADPSALTLLLPGGRGGADADPAGSQTGYVLQVGETGPRALLGHRRLSERVARLAALLDSEQAPLRDAHWIDLRYADRAVLRTEPASG